jgi:chromate reductase
MHVLGLSGSLRVGSFNTALLEAARELLPPRARLEIYTGLAAVPPYSEDRDRGLPPSAVGGLRRVLVAADALLIATPEYNGSVPGALKNAIDWASRPFPANALQDKPTAVVGASTGMFGAVWAQAELRKVLRTCGARVLECELAVANAADTLAAGTPLERQTRDLLSAVVEELILALEPTRPVAGRPLGGDALVA